MSKELIFDYSKASDFIREEEIVNMKGTVLEAKKVLTEKTGAGNDFLGWIDLPVDYDKEEFSRIKKAAAKIQEDSDVLLVIGIGGESMRRRIKQRGPLRIWQRKKGMSPLSYRMTWAAVSLF